MREVITSDQDVYLLSWNVSAGCSRAQVLADMMWMFWKAIFDNILRMHSLHYFECVGCCIANSNLKASCAAKAL